MEEQTVPSFWTRNNLTIRAFIVGFLSLILLIPAAFIQNLVGERQGRRREVQEEVSSKWSRAQTVTGPIVAIPYIERVVNTDDPKKFHDVHRMAFFLPEKLNIDSKVDPQTRQRSIFKVTVYESQLEMNGSFTPFNLADLHISPSDLLLDQASVLIGLSDFRGIEEQVTMDWQGRSLTFNAGLPGQAPIETGLSSPLPMTSEDLGKTVSFHVRLKLKGSDELSFTPVGKTTEVHMRSSWPNPSFGGDFLPLKPPAKSSPNGFTADWKILHLNRSFPQYWKDGELDRYKGSPAVPVTSPILAAAFGTRFYVTSDGYSMTERSIKYALLFIMLTFTLYFFIELFQKKRVHPLQYVLVGISLCVFYLLLLSISEFLGFAPAYLIAALATISLVTLYTRSVFASWKVAALFGSVLTFLYTFIFVLIQLEDDALLFGSIGLFAVLALVMWFSRKVDWYGKN